MLNFKLSHNPDFSFICFLKTKLKVFILNNQVKSTVKFVSIFNNVSKISTFTDLPIYSSMASLSINSDVLLPSLKPYFLGWLQQAFPCSHSHPCPFFLAIV